MASDLLKFQKEKDWTVGIAAAKLFKRSRKKLKLRPDTYNYIVSILTEDYTLNPIRDPIIL